MALRGLSSHGSRPARYSLSRILRFRVSSTYAWERDLARRPLPARSTNEAFVHDGSMPALSASELARRLLSGALSAVDVLDALFARIDGERRDWRGRVVGRRVCSSAGEGAADAAIARGRPCGPLHGVPITLEKDGIDVAGLQTTLGAQPFDRIADTDATVTARACARRARSSWVTPTCRRSPSLTTRARIRSSGARRTRGTSGERPADRAAVRPRRSPPA